MPRQQSKVQTASFVGGFVTEASPLTFPENSALDIQNMNINQNGSVSRRKGITLEENHSEFAYSVGVAHDYECFSWRNVAGQSGINFIAAKAGRYVLFYEEGENLSGGKASFQIDLNSYKVTDATTANVTANRVDMSYGKGYLFIVGKYTEPLVVEYDVDTNNISVLSFSLRIRDFDGVEDNLSPSERPSTLSSEHLYNLLNQGWSVERINAYQLHAGVYPSNADIWSAGRDANNNFSPAEMNKINFGNSLAPRGAFLTNAFNTSQSFSAPNRIPVSNTNLSTNTFTMSEDHGLSVSDTFNIIGSSGTYDDEGLTRTDDWDGVYTVDTVVNSTTVTVSSIPTLATTVTKNGSAEVGDISNPEGRISKWRVETVAFFAGRAFYAGVDSDYLADTVFFSQIITNKRKIGYCYQDADPTSDEISDLIDTDGGEVTITGLGKVTKMVPVQRSLLVFSENGIWEIAGGGEGYFRATEYSVRRITNIPCLSPKSVVEAEGVVFLFAQDGIYLIKENEISGLLSAESISDTTVKKYYLSLRDTCRRNAASIYDSRDKKIYWLFNTRGTGCPKQFDSALVFDLRVGAFYKHSFAIGSNYLVGVCVVRDVSSASLNVKYFTVLNDTHLSFSSLTDESFEDWGVDSEAFVITGHATLGDIGVKKQARQLILHMLRTETGFEMDGTSLVATNPSSCKVRITWDWSNDSTSNKWGPEFQGYRYRQLYTPTGVEDTFNTGYEVITTKTKLRGTGRAMSLRFFSDPEKDMVILGWSIAGDAETHE